MNWQSKIAALSNKVTLIPTWLEDVTARDEHCGPTARCAGDIQSNGTCIREFEASLRSVSVMLCYLERNRDDPVLLHRARTILRSWVLRGDRLHRSRERYRKQYRILGHDRLAVRFWVSLDNDPLDNYRLCTAFALMLRKELRLAIMMPVLCDEDYNVCLETIEKMRNCTVLGYDAMRRALQCDEPIPRMDTTEKIQLMFTMEKRFHELGKQLFKRNKLMRRMKNYESGGRPVRCFEERVLRQLNRVDQGWQHYIGVVKQRTVPPEPDTHLAPTEAGSVASSVVEVPACALVRECDEARFVEFMADRRSAEGTKYQFMAGR